jgi:hypothetical protein
MQVAAYELPRIPIPRTSVNKDIKKAERPGLDARSPARFYYALTVLSQAALAASAGLTATALNVVGAGMATSIPATSSVLANSVTALTGDADAANRSAPTAEKAAS